MSEDMKYVVDDNNMRKEPLTVQDAATYLGRSTEQVRRYLREGVLDGYRVGQQWFIPREAVEEKMEERTERRREELSALAERVNKRREALKSRFGELSLEAMIQEARESLP
jgi:excisionase family DNA binding protein